MTVPDNVRSGERATSAWANQLLAVVRDLDAHNDVVSITRSGSQLIVTQRDSTVTQLDIPTGGTTLPEYLQSDEEVLHSRAGSLYWDPINEVPIAGTVGHVLTKTGENDDEYAFRAPTGGGGGGDTSGLDARITTNAGDISELQTEVATASRSIADNEGRITTAETDINNLEAEDSTLAASIATNTTATQTNAGNIATNSNLISAATRTLQSLVTEVDTLHPKKSTCLLYTSPSPRDS